LTDLTKKNFVLIVLNRIRKLLSLDKAIFPNLLCDNVDLLETSHKLKLINAIAFRYIKICLHSYAKFYNQEILIRKRHRFTKLILFANQ